jgi:hypothetical protein
MIFPMSAYYVPLISTYYGSTYSGDLYRMICGKTFLLISKVNKISKLAIFTRVALVRSYNAGLSFALLFLFLLGH